MEAANHILKFLYARYQHKIRRQEVIDLDRLAAELNGVNTWRLIWPIKRQN